MRFFENSMWQSGRLGFEVPDPKTKESKASDNYVILFLFLSLHLASLHLEYVRSCTAAPKLHGFGEMMQMGPNPTSSENF